METAQQPGARDAEDKRARLARLLNARADGDAPAVYPLSQGQLGIWLAQQRDPDNNSWNVPCVLGLGPGLDLAALSSALELLLERHAVLRTSYVLSGQTPLQRTATGPVPLEVVEAAHWSDEQVSADIAGQVRRPVDLVRGPVFRARVLRRGPAGDVLLVLTHHIGVDGMSLGIFLAQLLELCQAVGSGRTPDPLPPGTATYHDYVRWQRDLLAGPAGQRLREYWERQLRSAQPVLRLPSRGTAPGGGTGQAPDGSHVFALDEPLVAKLRDLAQRHEITFYTLLLAVYFLLLHRYSGSDDILVAAPVNDRLGLGPAFQAMIGYAANQLLFRSRLTGDPAFDSFLGQTRDTVLGALDHHSYPFTLMAAELSRQTGASAGSIGDVGFTVHKAAAGPDWTGLSGHLSGRDRLEFGDMSIEIIPCPPVASKNRLMLEVCDSPGEVVGVLTYRGADVDPALAERMAGHYRELLAQVVARPDAPLSAIGMLPPDERQRVLTEWGGTGAAPPPATLPGLFEARAARTPQATAVICDAERLTYAELNAAANRLARHLAGLGIGPESVVAVAVKRSTDLVVAILAVVKAGAAFLPVDLDYPPSRIAFMLADAGPACVLATAGSAGLLPTAVAPPRVILDDETVAAAIGSRAAADLTDRDRVHPLRPAHPAYLLYTSGSTGVPKGAVITHAGIPGIAAAQAEQFGAHPGSRVLQFSSPSFDGVVFELCMALLSGGALVVPPAGRPLAGKPIIDLAAAHDVTIAVVPPTLLGALPDGSLPNITSLGAAGETFPADVAGRWAEGRRLLNVYGPTETTICATLHQVDQAEVRGSSTVPIGRPIPGTRVFVLDAWLQPVPPGVTGDLYIAGPGLARGYLARPALTAEWFVACPFGSQGERMYRTGDLARWTSGGLLEFVGRTDGQVKLRGFRVELGEVQAVLGRCPGVAQAVIVATDYARGGKKLIGYVVPADGGTTIDGPAARRFVAEHLPVYMVPAAVTVLAELPLTVNGKVDRAALPAPRFQAAASPRPPRTSRERLLCSVFAQVLGVDGVGAEDSFFDLGGDSIMAMQVVPRARRAGLELSVADVFAHPSAAALAQVAKDTADASGLAESPEAGTGEVPLTPVMHWLREQGGTAAGFSESVLLRGPPGMAVGQLTAAVQALVDHHDALRLRLRRAGDGAGWGLEARARGAVDAGDLVLRVDAAGLTDGALRAVIAGQAEAASRRLRPEAGLMLQAVWFDVGPRRPSRLLLVVHCLAVDGVSWRILLPDLAEALAAVAAGQCVRLDPVPVSFRTWARQLPRRADCHTAELPYWRQVLAKAGPPLGDRPFDPVLDTAATAFRTTLTLSAKYAAPLFTSAPADGGVADVLLASLALAVTEWHGRRGKGRDNAVLVGVRGHGRGHLTGGLDLSRTVGWFTNIYPVAVDAGPVSWPDVRAGGPVAGQVIPRVAERLRAVPGDGTGYGMLRYLSPKARPILAGLPEPQIGFTYLGRFSAGDVAGWSLAPESGVLSDGRDAAMPLPYIADLAVLALDGPDGPELRATWCCAGTLLPPGQFAELADLWFEALRGLVAYVGQREAELAPPG